MQKYFKYNQLRKTVTALSLFNHQTGLIARVKDILADAFIKNVLATASRLMVIILVF